MWILSVDLASELLRANPNSIAVVVSTELISQSLYHGHEKGMLLQNTLFRCGGAAVMLTNKASRIAQARYRLRHLVRTQCTDDKSYKAVYEQEDACGNCGVALSKEIVKVAGNAMAINLTQLGPLILPLSEQLRVVLSIARRKLGLSQPGTPKYVPSFKSAIHFFCIHSGGRAVAGSTAEICDEVGDDNVFIFGTRAGAVARVREQPAVVQGGLRGRAAGRCIGTPAARAALASICSSETLSFQWRRV